MKPSLFYAVISTILLGTLYNVWEYKNSLIPVPDLEVMKTIPIAPSAPVPRTFQIDKYEVTNSKYWRFSNQHSYAPGKEDFPVVNVTWHEAVEYAKWAGKRLPTVAEWEYAKTARKNEFVPWQAINPVKIELEPGEAPLFRVGKFWRDRAPFGMVDMAGNAWEWTADTLRLADGTLAAIVKGGFVRKNNVLLFSKTTLSDTLPADARFPHVGFRCVRDK